MAKFIGYIYIYIWMKINDKREREEKKIIRRDENEKSKGQSETNNQARTQSHKLKYLLHLLFSFLLSIRNIFLNIFFFIYIYSIFFFLQLKSNWNYLSFFLLFTIMFYNIFKKKKKPEMSKESDWFCWNLLACSVTDWPQNFPWGPRRQSDMILTYCTLWSSLLKI